MEELSRLIARAESLLYRLEGLLPAAPRAPAWDAAIAFRWRTSAAGGWLEAVTHPHRIRLADLKGIDEQKKIIDRNTRQFVEGRPANNVLLTGARGTGKSSLVKAVLHQYAKRGLRLIEIDKTHLADLPDIVDLIYARPERFILFCDDLAFAADEPGYQTLKAILDGSIASSSDNLLVYATSNRRHLMPEYLEENALTRHVGGEVHPAEAVEEKVSLSERFGIWLSFYPFDQDAYLEIVEHWVRMLGRLPANRASLHRAALNWALARGSRSGRVAWQFARDWVGRQAA
ncbi:ATP-binding protein [Thiobacter aerophilum]|uniref:ATP-binding protein n=1 Tax=Thiobacter aerophilum TaxID=3121275 RepID=A0ABV0EEY8_9BURK